MYIVLSEGMVRPGVVNVEISIEEHLIRDLEHLKDLFQQTLKAVNTGNNNLYVSSMREAQNLLRQIAKTLQYLKGLEGREPGKQKFVELDSIKSITKLIATMAASPVVNKTILEGYDDWLFESIVALRNLQKMELRLG